VCGLIVAAPTPKHVSDLYNDLLAHGPATLTVRARAVGRARVATRARALGLEAQLRTRPVS
jgi:hypothetical protein